MDDRGVVKAVVFGVVLILAGTLTSTLSAPLEGYKISLEMMGVTFKLPKGYAAFQQEHDGPDYFTTIYFGKEFRAGHLKSAGRGLEMEFSPMAHDSSGDHAPSKFVTEVFELAKGSFHGRVPCCKHGPEYIVLFGNKAVRYGFASGGTDFMFVYGYLRRDQLPPKSAARKHLEYHIGITDMAAYGQFSETEKQLFDTVVNSLQIIK